MYKFLLASDKSLKQLTVFINEVPPEFKLPEGTITSLEIILEVPLQGEYLEKFKETDGAQLFDIDVASFAMNMYTFFIFGFNTAADYFGRPQSKMTVEKFRQLIHEGKDKRVFALADFMNYWRNYEHVTFKNGSEVISQEAFRMLLVGSFQVGFIAQKL
jgi:hypothetical protein